MPGNGEDRSFSHEIFSEKKDGHGFYRQLMRTFRYRATVFGAIVFCFSVFATAAPSGDKGRSKETAVGDNPAIKVDSKDAEGWNDRGIARQTRGDLDGAIADYTRAIELDPKYARAYSSRSLVKRKKGDLKGAAADYNRAIELDPTLVKPPAQPLPRDDVKS